MSARAAHGFAKDTDYSGWWDHTRMRIRIEDRRVEVDEDDAQNLISRDQVHKYGDENVQRC